MSAIQKRLASYILREHFGDIADTIGTYLARRGARCLRDIVQETKLKREQVQKTLCALIQHRLVSHEKNKKKITIYTAEVDNIVLFLRFPRFQYTAKKLYGDTGELIIGEIQQHGSLPMSLVVSNVTEQCKLAGTQNTESDVRKAFTKLVDDHFLQRASHFVGDDTEDIDKEELQFVLPPEVSGKRKRSLGDQGNPSKRQKTQDGMSINDTRNLPDKDILWCINPNRFHQMFLEESIIDAVEKKFDTNGAEIIKTIFKKDSLSRDANAPTTCSMTLYEIAKDLPKSCHLENSRISQYLSLMVDDHDNFVKKIGESGGGTYLIDIKKSVTVLNQHTIQSILQERYGSDALRIVRLLLQKDHLEQKQIGELAMIPSKDAKELVYKLFSENVISMQEVAKTTDYAPSRTIYLFSVNLRRLSRTLLERCYQTIGNLMSRRQSEIHDHSRVLEKQDRMEATLMALKAQHGDEAAEEAAKELEELVTEADREQLKKLKAIIDKLQQSEQQVDDTIFIINQYLTHY